VATLASAGKYVGPKPSVHPESEAFWHGIGQGELKLQQCSECQTIRWPIAPVCYNCLSMDAEWVPAPTDGTISAAVRVERATGNQIWTTVTPFITGMVDMNGGHRLPGRIFCECGEALKHGTPVTAAYLEADDGVGVLCFTHACP
jgi:uncharacterized protein